MLAFELSEDSKRLTLFKRGPGRSPGEILWFLRAIMGVASSPSLSAVESDSSVFCLVSTVLCPLCWCAGFGGCGGFCAILCGSVACGVVHYA